MKKYYILRSDGSSIFKQAYSEDFIFHCLICLLDRTDEKFYLLSFGTAEVSFFPISIENFCNCFTKSAPGGIAGGAISKLQA